MILNAAGHGGVVNPLTFGQERRKLPTWAWGAIGVSIGLHAAGAIWIHSQRVNVATVETPEPDTRPPIELLRYKPPEPEPAQAQRTPQKPTIAVRAPQSPPVAGQTSIVPANPNGGAVGEITFDPPPVAPIAHGSGETAAPAAPETGPAKIANPKWLQKPTAAQMERHYPRSALASEATGSAMIRCAVTVSGNVTACSVISEEPAGQGFGAAALKLSRYFRMSPKTVAGEAVDGAIVDIRLAFTLD